MIVPETVTGPTKAPLFEPDIDILLHVCEFFTKKVDDKEPDVTDESVGVPISNVLPSTVPSKVSFASSSDVYVLFEPDITKSDCSLTTPDIYIIQLASFPGSSAVPLNVKLNAVAYALNADAILSKA